MENEGSPPHLHTIFVDTNIGTHLALIVSLHDTICDVKCKIRTEHALCFPNIGEIDIQAIKVRRRGFFYNLADSMYVLSAFDGVKGSWFVCIDAVPICHVKDQKLLTNKVTDGHPEQRDCALPVCGVDTGQEIALCGPPPKNQDTVTNMLLAKDLNTVMTSTSAEHRSNKSFDTSLKELPAEDGKSLHNVNISPPQILHVCPTDLLIPSDKNITALNGMKVNEAYLHEDVAVSQFELEKISGINGQGSHNPTVTSIDHSPRHETLIDSGDIMPSSTCTHKTKARKRDKKLKDGFHEERLDDYKRRAKLIRSEDNDESYKSVNLPREINGDGKKEILATSSERSLSKLPHENTIALLNLPVEKLKKKRKRKSKLHEEAQLATSTENLVVQSSQVTADLHTSGKEDTASIFLGKYPTALNNEKPLSNDDRDMSIAFDTTSLLEVSNQKEFGHAMGACLNKENIKVQTLQVNPVKRRKKDVQLGHETNLNVNLKEPEKAIMNLQVASDIQTKLSCSTNNFDSLSRKVLSHDETIDHRYKEIDSVKCITDLNLREDEDGSVDAKAGISASEKPSYQEQALNLLSKDSSSDKHQGLDKKINAAANPEGANIDRFLAQVNSKVSSKSQCRKKKSKTEPLKISDPTQVKLNGEHFNYDGAEVFLSDVPNDSDATMFIKQAIQKVNGVHSLDNMIGLSSSSKKLSNQDLVPPMNSDNPPISVPHNLSKKSNASVKIAANLNVSLQPASEVQGKQRRSRKKSKSELSKLRSPKISDAVLPEFNGEVAESNERRGFESSKLDNLSNQKIEPHCIDAMAIDPCSNVDSTMLVNAHQVNPLDSPSCKRLDLKGLSNAEIIIKDGDVAQLGYLASPTKSKCDRKKSKKEKLEARDSSKMSEHLELHRPDNSSLKFVPKEVEHHPDVQSATDHPSRKSETKRKHRTTSKTDINQYQDCPTNSAQPSSHKQHKGTCQPQVNDTNQHKQHKVTGQSQDDGKSHYNAVDASQDAATKDYKTENACKGKKTKQSSKHNSASARIESDFSLQKAHDNQKREKKLQGYEPQSLAQPSKSGGMFNKQEKKITADGKGEIRSLAPQKGILKLDHGINNLLTKDGVVLYKDHNSSTISNPVCDALGSNIFDVPLSKGIVHVEALSDSTKDTQDHNIQYRVVRKIPRKSSKKIITNSNPEKLLSVSSGRMFSDASGASSNCESGSSKHKAAIGTDADGLTTYGDLDSHLEETQIKANALKLRMETSFSDAESDKSGEVGNNTDGKVDDRSRHAVSNQKNLKRSSNHGKDRPTVSQSEFADTESQPVDVVLETQLELAP